MTNEEAGGINLNEIINSAIKEGIDAIVDSHPAFKGNEELFYNHIDKKRLKEITTKIYLELSKYNISPDEMPKYLHHELASYIAGGNALDKDGKNFLCAKGLEAKVQGGFFKNLFSKSKSRGEENLINALKGFQDLYSLFKSGDYAQHMPELAEAVVKVRNMGFLDNAISVLKNYKLMTKEKYKFLKESLNYQLQQIKILYQGKHFYFLMRSKHVQKHLLP